MNNKPCHHSDTKVQAARQPATYTEAKIVTKLAGGDAQDLSLISHIFAVQFNSGKLERTTI